VISNTLLHHLPEPRDAVATAVRIVSPGGRIFIRDLVRPATVKEIDHLVDMHTTGESESAKKMFRDSLFAALTLQEARDMFASFGFPPSTVNMTSDRHWTFDGKVV